MKSFFLFLIFVVTNLSNASADNRILRSVEGQEIRLDYRILHYVENSNKPSTTDSADPLVITVTGSQLKESDRVRVVLINNEAFRGQCGLPVYDRSPNYVIDLRATGGGGFQGTFAEARILLDGQEVPLQPQDRRLQLYYSGFCNAVYTSQELALVVNGRWSTDPVNHTHNFKLNLLK